jgi:pullulanase/glycogen debranching enzyme
MHDQAVLPSDTESIGVNSRTGHRRSRRETDASQIWPGTPYPRGALYDGAGVNFSIYSEVADRIELCLFDDRGRETRFELPEMTSFCFHGYLSNVHPGQR